MSTNSSTFEEKMMRLLETAEALEAGGVPLSDAVNLYSDAVSLIESMKSELKETSGRVTIISKSIDGLFTEEDFDEF